MSGMTFWQGEALTTNDAPALYLVPRRHPSSFLGVHHLKRALLQVLKGGAQDVEEIVVHGGSGERPQCAIVFDREHSMPC